MTSQRLPRSRRTRYLVELAWERFHGCEECRRADAFDCIDDVLGPLRLKQREVKRLFRRLTCPGCESMVPSGSLVATPSEEQVKQSISFKKFERLHRHHVEEFRTSLIQYPMLGAQDPFGQLLVKSMRKAKNTVLQPSCWYRAVAHTPDPDFEPRSRYETINAGRYNQIGQRVWYLGAC